MLIIFENAERRNEVGKIIKDGEGWVVIEGLGILHTCTECNHEQAFMGNDVCCEECEGMMFDVPEDIVEKYE